MSAEEARERLRATVTAVREQIGRMRDRATKIGEQNTKAVLIEPVIEALGWDLRDLEQVVREYRSNPQDNPVDYALLLRRSPLLFIEAKDLDSDLSDRRWVSQIMGYATVVGVEWCLLTDGDKYHIYNAHAPVDVEEKLFRAVSLSDRETEEAAISTLLLLSKEKLAADELKELWEACFVDCQVQRALEDLLIADNAGIVRLIRRQVPELKPSQIRQSLARADIRIEFPTGSGTPVAPATPAAARPDEPEAKKDKGVAIAGEVYPCRYAKDIPVHVANWLVAQGRLPVDRCPVVVTRHSGQGADRCLINTAPTHLDGSDFRAPVELANGLFMETHASRRELERYAQRLLEWAGVDVKVMRVVWPD